MGIVRWKEQKGVNVKWYDLHFTGEIKIIRIYFGSHYLD